MKLISDYYKRQNELLHISPEKYGQRGHRHLGKVDELRRRYKCETILDYGAGTGELSKKAPFKVENYDPGVPEFEELPEPADLIVCTDVLEHIEVELLDNVLTHIEGLMGKVGWFVIATRPDTSKTLPDGTNPHKIIKDHAWWTLELDKYFNVTSSENVQDREVKCIVLKR